MEGNKTKLFLEKRINNEVLLINPHTKLDKKMKLSDKNSFYLNSIPFAPNVKNLKTGFIYETNETKDKETASEQNEATKYMKELTQSIRESDIHDQLNSIEFDSKKHSLLENFEEILDISHPSCKAVETSLNNVSQSIWKNSFVLINPNSFFSKTQLQTNYIISPLKSFISANPSEKIVVLDWGISHSSATQSTFYDNPNVLFISIHKEKLCNQKNIFDPKKSWEHTSIGDDKGVGFNLNFPLDVGDEEYFEDSRYLFVFERAIIPIIRSFKPDLILIMNGLESLLDDPLGKLKLTGNSKL
jgi:hypothetical protein